MSKKPSPRDLPMILADIGEVYGELCSAVTNYEDMRVIIFIFDRLHDTVIASHAKIREMPTKKGVKNDIKH